MSLADSKFVQTAIKEGVQDIVASYGEAIDKFVADPEVRMAIKMSAGAGIMRRIFDRLANTESPVENEAGSEKPTGDAEQSFGMDFSKWSDDKF